MPPRSYYWPQEPPAGSEAIPDKKGPEDSSIAPNSIRPLPIIIISPPSPDPESLESPRKALDNTKLHSRYVKKTKPFKPLGPVQKKRKREEEDTCVPHSPTPSLFSYNICRDDACPMDFIHEKGTYRDYRDSDKDRIVPEGIAAEVVERMFGDSNPPSWLWEDVKVVVDTNGCADESSRKRREEALACVTGFARAHFSDAMTEEAIGNLLSK